MPNQGVETHIHGFSVLGFVILPCPFSNVEAGGRGISVEEREEVVCCRVGQRILQVRGLRAIFTCRTAASSYR